MVGARDGDDPNSDDMLASVTLVDHAAALPTETP
jgi:hypothetical protein